jgi:hypothetical protein
MIWYPFFSLSYDQSFSTTGRLLALTGDGQYPLPANQVSPGCWSRRRAWSAFFDFNPIV